MLYKQNAHTFVNFYLNDVLNFQDIYYSPFMSKASCSIQKRIKQILPCRRLQHYLMYTISIMYVSLAHGILSIA